MLQSGAEEGMLQSGAEEGMLQSGTEEGMLQSGTEEGTDIRASPEPLPTHAAILMTWLDTPLIDIPNRPLSILGCIP